MSALGPTLLLIGLGCLAARLANCAAHAALPGPPSRQTAPMLLHNNQAAFNFLQPNESAPGAPKSPAGQRQRLLLATAAAAGGAPIGPAGSIQHQQPPASPLTQLAPQAGLQDAFGQQQQQQQTNPFTLTTHKLLLELRQQMLSRAIKFDEHFRTLLSHSKLSLHNMFVDTYGMMYEHNTEIFTSMYESLEQYYATGQVKLTKSMENFFERLYQKIFQVYNSNRAFTPSYLDCATEQLAHLKPFRDAPERLIEEIRHAFVAARTFNQALNTGIDVIRGIISLGQPPQCVSLINDKLLRYVALNRGADDEPLPAPARKPCLAYCEQVIKNCIGPSNWEQVSGRWRTYVVSLAELAKKLSVHYNIETIIAPLDVQISEAIMNFQENAQNISQQVFQACGTSTSGDSQSAAAARLSPVKPLQNRLGRRWAPAPGPAVLSQRRPAPFAGYHSPTGDEFSSLNLDQLEQHQHQQQPARQMPAAASKSGQFEAGAARLGATGAHYQRSSPAALFPHEVEPLAQPAGKRSPVIIDEIKDYMLSTKLFWSNLPNSVCTSNQTLGLNATLNGNSRRVQYAGGGAGGGGGAQCFTEPLGLSDMNTDLNFKREIEKQVAKLEAMHAKIVNALNGNEIDWSSGSGASAAGDFQARPSGQSISGRPPASQPSPAGRPPVIATSTTSTTPAPELSAADDEDTEDEEPIEPGSGSTPPNLDATSDEDAEDTTTEPYDDEYAPDETGPTDDETNNNTNHANPAADKRPEQAGNNPQHSQPTDDQALDSGKRNDLVLDPPNDLITSDAQRSNGSASRLVIIDQLRLFSMLLNLVIVSLLLPQTRNLTPAST